MNILTHAQALRNHIQVTLSGHMMHLASFHVTTALSILIFDYDHFKIQIAITFR